MVNILNSIGDYDNLITTLGNLESNDEPIAIAYLAQALWLTIQIPKDLEGAIYLINDLIELVSTDRSLTALLGAAALYLCQTLSHPDIVDLNELSGQIISRAADRLRLSQS
jgi:hypothetical protein